MLHRTLILELDERRTAADVAVQEKVLRLLLALLVLSRRIRQPAALRCPALRCGVQEILLDDAERLKHQVLERDAQLAQYMSQLASQLASMSPTHSANTSAEQHASVGGAQCCESVGVSVGGRGS